jgi:hypothetical protein
MDLERTLSEPRAGLGILSIGNGEVPRGAILTRTVSGQALTLAGVLKKRD